ncbi:MAG: hypothetical protein ACREEQ_12185, partial [Caulobacteraceae bacterium]
TDEGAVSDRMQQALRAPLGAASPLWAVFGAAAGVGVAYWWLTRWARPLNIEALAGLAEKADPPRRRIEIIAEPETPAPEPVAASAPAAPANPAPQTPSTAELFAEAPADDLTRLAGVGPKLSAALGAHGVTTFAQIAAWTERDVAEIDAALGLKGRAHRDAWVAQAHRLARGG